LKLVDILDLAGLVFGMNIDSDGARLTRQDDFVIVKVSWRTSAWRRPERSCQNRDRSIPAERAARQRSIRSGLCHESAGHAAGRLFRREFEGCCSRVANKEESLELFSGEHVTEVARS